MVTADARGPNRSDTAPAQANMWRLHYHVGGLEHYTEWTTEFPTIENYYDQYRRGDYAHDVAIERRAVIEK